VNNGDGAFSYLPSCSRRWFVEGEVDCAVGLRWTCDDVGGREMTSCDMTATMR